jgi:hypothetical protein
MINATAEQFQDKENTVRAVIVNSTIFGRPIVDLLRKEVTRNTAHFINVISWGIEDIESRPWRIPILDIVGAVQVLLQNGLFRIEQHLHADLAVERDALWRALHAFNIDVSSLPAEAPRIWGEGPHRALVMSIALACWAAIHPEICPASK